jgi:hypothetical protein
MSRAIERGRVGYIPGLIFDGGGLLATGAGSAGDCRLTEARSGRNVAVSFVYGRAEVQVAATKKRILSYRDSRESPAPCKRFSRFAQTS